MRPGGVILVDNVLQGGRVVDDDARRRQRGRHPPVQRPVAADERVDVAMLPIRDGVTLAVKR